MNDIKVQKLEVNCTKKYENSKLIKSNIIIFFIFIFSLVIITFSYSKKERLLRADFITFIVDLKTQDLKFYWKDDKGKNFRSLRNLKKWIESKHKRLDFAMNGGMYKVNNMPQGLFIDNQKIVSSLDSSSGNGNFYLKPNGVFYITTDDMPGISHTEKFSNNNGIKYATQSGPILVTEGKIHPMFKAGSTNLNIRNGVGILADNRIVFVMSKKIINFYDFANYFISLGCKNALYLDGFVSRTYLPEQNWFQLDGDFGVIIGITSPSL